MIFFLFSCVAGQGLVPKSTNEMEANKGCTNGKRQGNRTAETRYNRATTGSADGRKRNSERSAQINVVVIQTFNEWVLHGPIREWMSALWICVLFIYYIYAICYPSKKTVSHTHLYRFDMRGASCFIFQCVVLLWHFSPPNPFLLNKICLN